MRPHRHFLVRGPVLSSLLSPFSPLLLYCRFAEIGATRFELATFCTPCTGHTVLTAENKDFTTGEPSACTNACTGYAEKRHDSGRDEGPGDGATTGGADTSASAGQLAGAELAKALAMIAELPLSATDKAEAVRRLLAGR